MKTKNTRWFTVFSLALSLMLLSYPSLVHASDKPETVRFKPGETGLLGFLETASEKLGIQIDASGLTEADLGRVNIPDAGALSSDRAKELLLTILYLRGFGWIHDEGTDIYRVLRQRDARDQEIPLIADGTPLPDSDLLVTYIMKIEHTSPDYLARMMRSFMPANARIMSFDEMGSVMITDSARNISKLKTLIRGLDNPEVAKEAKEWMLERAKKNELSCPAPQNGAPIQQTWVLIGLFSLIALVIGFLSRGYVIRRIEGGL